MPRSKDPVPVKKKRGRKKKVEVPAVVKPEPLAPAPTSPEPLKDVPVKGIEVGQDFQWQGRLWSVQGVGEEKVVAVTKDGKKPGLIKKIDKKEVV